MASRSPRIQMGEECDVEKQNGDCSNHVDSSLTESAVKPPDGGWGWVIVVASLYISSIYIGLVLSFGILFRDPLTSMGVSSTNVAWILNIHFFMWHMTSTLAGPLCQHFGWMKVGFVGCLVSSVGFMLMCFATSPIHILLLFGFLIGIAGGASANICFLVVVAYFDKRKGTATGIMMTGIAAGQIFVPLLLRALLDEYGFVGTTLIFGAIVSNCCVVSLLFHPVERHQKTRRHCVIQSVELQTSEKIGNCEEVPLSENVSHSPRIKIKRGTETPLRHSNNVIINIVKTSFRLLKEIKQLKIFILTMSFALIMIGYTNFMAQLPFAMQAIGHGPHEASWCISVSAIGNTITRIVFSCFSDRKWFSRKVCYLSGSVIAGISTLGVVLQLDDVRGIMVCLVFWGIGIGANLSVYHALIIDTCGLPLYVSCFTVGGFLMATTSIITGPCIGLISDLSSYSWSMSACAVMQLGCALLWILMPLAERGAVTQQKDQSQLEKFTETNNTDDKNH